VRRVVEVQFAFGYCGCGVDVDVFDELGCRVFNARCYVPESGSCGSWSSASAGFGTEFDTAGAVGGQDAVVVEFGRQEGLDLELVAAAIFVVWVVYFRVGVPLDAAAAGWAQPEVGEVFRGA
jgi:hypothetical protein